jgi:hypothetical protein
LLVILERFHARFMLPLLRQPSPSLSQRLRAAPVAFLVAAGFCWLVFVSAAFFHPNPVPTRVSIGLWVSSFALVAAAIGYWGGFVRWPYNRLGYLLITGEPLMSDTLPSEMIASSVSSVWQNRFGSDGLEASRHLWRLGDLRTRWFLGLFVTTTFMVDFVPSKVVVGFAAIMVIQGTCVGVYYVRSEAQTQLVRQVIGDHLGLMRFDGLPPFDPQFYGIWLDSWREIKE